MHIYACICVSAYLQTCATHSLEEAEAAGKRMHASRRSIIKALLRLYQGSIKALSRLYQGSIKALSRLYQGSDACMLEEAACRSMRMKEGGGMHAAGP
jgi:hypothetical protein